MADVPLVDNAADPEQVKRSRHKTKDAALLRKGLVAAQMATPVGRQFVWGELERHGIYDRIDPRGMDAHGVGAFLGTRDAGLHLMIELMDEHADAFLVMQAEALQRKKAEQAERAAVKLSRTTEKTE